jgi:23S rRNA (uridine2552-2'-O)-methyltransferase
LADYRRPDHYARRARQEGFAARSAYKLAEMDRKWGLLAPGDAVLDLGASPGSWTQYALGKGAKVVAVDLKRLTRGLGGRVAFVQADVFEVEPERLKEASPGGQGYDAVISDMAPATSGDRFVDSQRSLRLAERALEIAREVLKPGGSLVIKLFQGEDDAAFAREMAQGFAELKRFKPKTSRAESSEIYLVGLSQRPVGQED